VQLGFELGAGVLEDLLEAFKDVGRGSLLPGGGGGRRLPFTLLRLVHDMRVEGDLAGEPRGDLLSKLQALVTVFREELEDAFGGFLVVGGYGGRSVILVEDVAACLGFGLFLLELGEGRGDALVGLGRAFPLSDAGVVPRTERNADLALGFRGLPLLRGENGDGLAGAAARDVAPGADPERDGAHAVAEVDVTPGLAGLT